MVAVEVEGFGGPAVPWTVQEFKKETTVRAFSRHGPAWLWKTVVFTGFDG
jgi:hypothetical protein